MTTQIQTASADIETPEATPETNGFADLGLSAALQQTVTRLGYATPTPVQALAIPPLLAGRDVLAQAQTGTGKTAAFALPLLHQIDMADPRVQALVLVPTRELALQVAEAMHDYAAGLGAVGVLPIFGGDPIARQLARLEKCVRVVVGTPGRVLDHLGRGSLQLDGVRMVVLDEADEMLRMGFADDVESILGQAPATRQTALFSATLPAEIGRVAQRHLRNPETLTVAAQTRTVAAVDQRYVIVDPGLRVEALARLLSVEPFEAALVFARTRAGCAELAEALEDRGFATEAMHGDMAQSARQSVIRRLKNGQLRIVVATDVAARGLDVEQIDLVVNVELPHDAATYVHRIGRTGRAGRSGRSILFVTPRDERRLREIERFIGQRLVHRTVPSAADLQAARLARLAAGIERVLATDDLTAFRALVARVAAGRTEADVAAALARLVWGEDQVPVAAVQAAPAPEPSQAVEPALPAGKKKAAKVKAGAQAPVTAAAEPADTPAAVAPSASSAPAAQKPPRQAAAELVERPTVAETGFAAPTPPVRSERTQTIRPPRPARAEGVWLSLGVGRRNGVQPRDIVGAIANEAKIGSGSIGAIDIQENYTLVELAAACVPEVMARMRKAMICGRYLNIRLLADPGGRAPAPRPSHAAPRRRAQA